MLLGRKLSHSLAFEVIFNSMPLALHTLKPAPRRRHRRLGRGEGSGRGKTAGRGTKGQRSRTGGRSGLKTRALKSLYQRLPKIGGFRSLRPKAVAISLDMLNRYFPAGAQVTASDLVRRGLASAGRPIKILSTGNISHALTIRGCQVSAAAREKIVAVGGTID